MLPQKTSLSRQIAIRGSKEARSEYSQSLESALATDFSRIPEVNRILVERAEGNLLVWIAADHPSAAVREQVFQRQFDLIDGFPEISFDFNLVSTNAQDPSEIAPSAKLVYLR